MHCDIVAVVVGAPPPLPGVISVISENPKRTVPAAHPPPVTIRIPVPTPNPPPPAPQLQQTQSVPGARGWLLPRGGAHVRPRGEGVISVISEKPKRTVPAARLRAG